MQLVSDMTAIAQAGVDNGIDTIDLQALSDGLIQITQQLAASGVLAQLDQYAFQNYDAIMDRIVNRVTPDDCTPLDMWVSDGTYAHWWRSGQIPVAYAQGLDFWSQPPWFNQLWCNFTWWESWIIAIHALLIGIVSKPLGILLGLLAKLLDAVRKLKGCHS